MSLLNKLRHNYVIGSFGLLPATAAFGCEGKNYTGCNTELDGENTDAGDLEQCVNNQPPRPIISRGDNYDQLLVNDRVQLSMSESYDPDCQDNLNCCPDNTNQGIKFFYWEFSNWVLEEKRVSWDDLRDSSYTYSNNRDLTLFFAFPGRYLVSLYVEDEFGEIRRASDSFYVRPLDDEY